MTTRSSILASLAASLIVAVPVAIVATSDDPTEPAVEQTAETPDAGPCVLLEIRASSSAPACLDVEKGAALLDAGRALLSGREPASLTVFDCPACPAGLGLEAADAQGRASGPMPDTVPAP